MTTGISRHKGDIYSDTPHHDVGCDWYRFQQLTDMGRAAEEPDEARYLTAALTLARSAPFDAARARAFSWAGDQCFDSRIRVEIATAADRLSQLASASHSGLGRSKCADTAA